MYNMNTMNTMNTMKNAQKGITLIESLVAIVVTALGILGILGVQMRTLTDTSTTARRAQAVRLIEDFSERLKSNPNALANINSYISDFSDSPAITSCAAGCDNSELITHELAKWKNSVRNQLPLGQASIFTPPAEDGLAAGQRRQLGILIAWRENEREISSITDKKDYQKSMDATKILKEDGSLVAGGGTDKTTNACPDNATCHLQYISVPARCAPFAPGGGTPIYYCPGS